MGASSAALPKPKRGSGSSSRRWGSSASGAITALRPSSDATDCAYCGNSESGRDASTTSDPSRIGVNTGGSPPASSSRRVATSAI